MKNFDLNKIKEKMAREFFFYKYYRYNNTYDFIPDEFVLKVIKGDFEDVFTEEELSYIHYVLDISNEIKLRNSGEIRINVVLKLNNSLNGFRCEQKGETLIEVLNLSKRCYSALHGYDIISVEQLIMCSKEELNNIRNLGKILIEEIIDKVHEYGLNFYFEYTKEEQISYLLNYKEYIKEYNDMQIEKETTEKNVSSEDDSLLFTLGNFEKNQDEFMRLYIDEIRNKLANGFFYNKHLDLISDELCLQILRGNLSDKFTEEEKNCIYIITGICTSEKKVSYTLLNQVAKKLETILYKEKCEKENQTFIDVLNLSSRGYNGLTRNNIFSVEQLILCSKEDLQMFRNLGEGTIKEIIEKLHMYGKRFIFEYPIEKQITILEENNKKMNNVMVSYKGVFDNNETPIDVLNLSSRTYNALIRNGIFSVEKLKECNIETLKCFRNLGDISINEIFEKVDEYNNSIILI